MTDGDTTKVCPLCAETIKAKARVCPYCRAPQSRYALWLQNTFVFVPVIAVVIVAVFILSKFAPVPDDFEGLGFKVHRNDLAVSGTHMVSEGASPNLWMTGVVTNRGSHSWRVQELEVRFLDGQGKLLDVSHPQAKDSFVVGAGQDTAFRIRLYRPAFTNDSVVRQVRVQLATDGDRPPKPN